MTHTPRERRAVREALKKMASLGLSEFYFATGAEHREARERAANWIDREYPPLPDALPEIERFLVTTSNTGEWYRPTIESAREVAGRTLNARIYRLECVEDGSVYFAHRGLSGNWLAG